MVEHLAVLWPRRLWLPMYVEVWESKKYEAVVLDYFRMHGNQSREVRGTGTMELLGLGDNVVGTGVLQDNIKCRMELNAVRLYPFEMVVQVVRLLEESVWTGEIVGK